MSDGWPLTNHGEPWTEVQEQVLREAFGKVPVERIAKALGRTVKAVEVRAKAIGVFDGRRLWTDEEVARLAGLRLQMPMRQVAEALGRSKYACQRKVLDMRKAGDVRFPILKKEE